MVGDEIVARVRGPNQVTVVKTDVDGQWADLNVTLSFIHIAGLVGPKFEEANIPNDKYQ